MDRLEVAGLTVLALIPLIAGMVLLVRSAKRNRNFAGAALAVAVLFMPIPDPPPQLEIEESDSDDDQGDPPEAGASTS